MRKIGLLVGLCVMALGISSVAVAQVGIFDKGLTLDSKQYTHVAAPGSASFSNGTYTLSGNGRDIWDNGDEGYWVYTELAGMNSISAKVKWITSKGDAAGGSDWTKIGVMIRETGDSPESKHYWMDYRGGAGTAALGDRVDVQWREVDNAASGNVQVFMPDGKTDVKSNSGVWLRVSRYSSSLFVGEYSLDGVNWVFNNSHIVKMKASAAYGIIITSHKEDTVLVTAEASDVKLGPTVNAVNNVITFQDGVQPWEGYNGTSDAHIISWDGAVNQMDRDPTKKYTPHNAGAHTFLEEGDYNATGGNLDSKVILIKFDVSSFVKKAATVTSAQIGLYYAFERSAGSTDPKAGLKNKHNLYTQKILKKWGEGNSGGVYNAGVDGSVALAGEVSWDSTGYEKWELLGGEGKTDVGPISTTTAFDPGASLGQWVWIDVTAIAKEWVASPETNFGLKISQNTKASYDDPTKPATYVGGAYDFASSENPTKANHPQLMIMGGGLSEAGDWSLYE